MRQGLMKTNPMTNRRQPIFGCIGVATMLQERQVRAFQDPLLGGKCHQNRPQVPCLQNFGMPTSDVEINYFILCDPHHDMYTFSYWQIFWHSI